MKKLLFILFFILLISPAYAKYESGSGDAESVVLYGKYNNTLVPVKVNSNGSIAIVPLNVVGTSDQTVVNIYRGTDTSPTEDILRIYNNAGDTVLFKIDKNGMPSYQPAAASPSVVAGTGAGTSPTLAISGSDTAGIITLTTGTACATSATILTATFTAINLSFSPGVVISPMNGNAAALSGNASVYTNSTTTTFLLKVGSTALADSTQYIWAYKLAAY